MLPKDATAGSQAVLNEVVMESDHSLQGLLDSPERQEEDQALKEAEHHLNHDSDNDRGPLHVIDLLLTVSIIDRLVVYILCESEVYHEATVREACEEKSYQAVEGRLANVLHSVNLDDTLIVGDVSAQQDESDGAHKTSDFEDVNGPNICALQSSLT